MLSLQDVVQQGRFAGPGVPNSSELRLKNGGVWEEQKRKAQEYTRYILGHNGLSGYVHNKPGIFLVFIFLPLLKACMLKPSGSEKTREDGHGNESLLGGHRLNKKCEMILENCGLRKASIVRSPKDHINIRILQTIISGIHLVLGLGPRMSDAYG